MIYAQIENNFLKGFYTKEIHKNIPNNCIEISKEIHEEILNNGFNFFDGQIWSFKDSRSQEEITQDINNVIYSQLEEIDKKKTRALTDALLTGDNSRLLELETEAATLRQQLQ